MMVASYAFLWLELYNEQAHVVIRESRIQFHSPVRGRLYAVCGRPALQELEKLRAEFAAKGKARIALQVRIEQEGQTAAILDGTYVVQA
jgi:thioesterase domain-containing protein